MTIKVILTIDELDDDADLSILNELMITISEFSEGYYYPIAVATDFSKCEFDYLNDETIVDVEPEPQPAETTPTVFSV